MPSALVLYHYFYPDQVVSAIHLTELATGLAQRGWSVTAMPSNRSCRDQKALYERKSVHEGVTIRRIWRPAFVQASTLGRLANSAWMFAAWSFHAFTKRPDVLIVGTDPIFSFVTVLFWKLLSPKTRLVHWCFDLYPEAAAAEGLVKPGPILSALRFWAASAYKRFDLIVDIGDCMRKRLSLYPTHAVKQTLPPWALVEPPKPLAVSLPERRAAFGYAKLVLLYSGSFGRSHLYREILTLARSTRGAGLEFGFSITGNCASQIRDAVGPEDSNISFLPFASKEALETRLSTADIHIVTLASHWTGTVVPSKFFGALASGRPVLFIGSPQSSIALVIRKYGVGWVWQEGTEPDPDLLADLLCLADDAERLQALRERCHRVYREHFSRETIIDEFDSCLKSLVGELVQNNTPDEAARAAAGF